MPVEIKELIIKVSVEESRQSSNDPAKSANNSNQQNWDQEQILKAALEQTLEVLNQKKER